MGQAKRRQDTASKGITLKDRRKATIIGIGSGVGASLTAVAVNAAVAQDRQRYHSNKEKAKNEKAKKLYNSNRELLWDRMDREEKKLTRDYGASAAGVTYKHHANIQKINKGRKF